MSRARRLVGAGIVVVGAAAVAGWFLSAPVRLDAATLAGLHPGDATKGERIFNAGGCVSCHARPKAEGEARLELVGGVQLKTPFGTFVTPNISQDPKDGIGAWSPQDFANAMLRGVAPDGTIRTSQAQACQYDYAASAGVGAAGGALAGSLIGRANQGQNALIGAAAGAMFALLLTSYLEKRCKALDAAPTPGGYLRIARRWKKGDTVVLETPMTLRTESFADDPSLQAVLYGPLVLAGQFPLGTLPPPTPPDVEKPHGPAVARYPIVVPTLAAAGGKLHEALVPDGPLQWRTRGPAQPIVFRPFWRSQERYAVYWQTV